MTRTLAMQHPLRGLQVVGGKEEQNEGIEQIWIPDKQHGFRLCTVLERTLDDIVVGFRDEQGFFEKKRLRVYLCEPTSTRHLADDLCLLTEPNAATVLHSLRSRYSRSIIHTNCGVFCVVLNPWKNIDIYNNTIKHIYRHGLEKNLPPHVYNVAQNAIEGIMRGETHQSILITGESGAGKTENTKRIIEYIVNEHPDRPTSSVDSAILMCTELLEAFGNAKTTHNDNSSRFGKFIRLFVEEGAADMQCYLLEKCRVVGQNTGERGFHIFYQLISPGFALQTRKGLHLTDFASFQYLSHGSQPTKEDCKAAIDTNLALERLGLDEGTRMAIYEVVAACLLIGQIEFGERTGMDMSFVQSRRELEWTAELLAVNPSTLDSALTQPVIDIGGNTVRKNQKKDKTLACAAAMAKTIYERLFLWIVDKCNENIGTHSDTPRSRYIGVLDIAGFEMIELNSFEQLCINYTNECLQQLFNHCTFLREQAEYLEEGIDWVGEDYAADLDPAIALIEQPLGILSLLEEECVVPNGHQQRFVDKILEKHTPSPSLRKAKISHRSTAIHHFTVSHYAGDVDYNVDRWLEKNRDWLDKSVEDLLCSSSHPLINQLFQKKVSPPPKHRRGSSTRSPASNTVSFVYRQQLQSLMSVLSSSHAHFIRCVVPNRMAQPMVFDGPLVIHQLKCNGVLEGIRICRKGFPSRYSFEEFRDRYSILGTRGGSRLAGREGLLALCQEIIEDPECYRVGKTKVMCKVGVTSELEEKRNEKIGMLLGGLQAHIRWHLQLINRQRLINIRSAILTIQNNVRVSIALRDWPWFRIWMLIKPLVSHEKIQKKMQALADEVHLWKHKYDMLTITNDDLIKTIHDLRKEVQRMHSKEESALDHLKKLEIERKEEKKEMVEEMKRGEETLALLEQRFQQQHEKVMKMSDHLREYERNHERMHMENEQLEKELQKMKMLVDEGRAEIEELNGEHREALDTITTHEATIQTLQQQRNALSLQLAKSQTEAENHAERATRFSDTIQELQKNMIEMTEKVARVDGIVNGEKNLRKKAEKELEETRERVKEREDRIKHITKKYDAIKEDLRDRDRRTRQLEKKLSDKEAIMDTCVRELKESHKARISEMNEKVDELKRRNSKLESELRMTPSIMEKSFERESSIDSDYGASSGFTLRRSSSRLSRQTSFSSISSLSSIRTLNRRPPETVPENVQYPLSRTNSSSLIEKDRKISDLERQIQTMNTDAQLAKREIDVYKTTIATNDSEKRALTKQNKSQAERIEQMTKEYDEHEKKIGILEMRLKRSHGDIEEWRRRWEDNNNQNNDVVSSQRKKFIERIEALEHEKHQKENRITSLENTRDELIHELDKARKELDRIRMRLEDMEKCNEGQQILGENWQMRCRDAEAELQNLRDDNCALKDKIRRLYRQIQIFTQEQDTSVEVGRMNGKMEQMDGH